MRFDQHLIYDIGLHNGADTAYYLSLGFSVVAVEANHTLVEQANERFREEVNAGRLVVLNVGLADSCGIATFWINAVNDEQSSFVSDWRPRARTHPVQVPTTTLDRLIETHGVPYYMKIDIEGSDIHCLEALTPGTSPPYISVEAHHLSYLALLYSLGYRKFKCIDQSNHNVVRTFHNEAFFGLSGRASVPKRYIGSKLSTDRLQRLNALLGRHQPAARTGEENEVRFPQGSSGPFGDDTRGEWQDLEVVAYNWLHVQTGHHSRGTLNMNGWYDFHASK